MLVARLPASKPPPCTRIAAGKGPGPSGTCRSSSSAWPPGLPYSTPFWLIGEAGGKTGQVEARRLILLGVLYRDSRLRRAQVLRRLLAAGAVLRRMRWSSVVPL